MKKILCLTLALLMIMMMAVACKKDKTDGAESTDAGTPDYDGSVPSGNEDDPDESKGYFGEEDEDVLVECNDTVYVVNAPNGLNLRSSMNTDGAAASWVKEGTELKRIAKGDEWSKVVYQNKEYYAISKYLSTEPGGAPDTKPETSPEVDIVFEDRNETVYVKESAKIRSTPDKTNDENVVDWLDAGTELKRTGIAYDTENDPEGLGWSRVEYLGKVCYIRNSTLSDTNPNA